MSTVQIPDVIRESKLEKAFIESIEYLNSDLAIDSINSDPYWPKWDTPWWHMSLLYEMGLEKFIPDSVVTCVMDMMGKHYLQFFPIQEHELPENIDPYTRIPCHCQLGNMYQILKAKRPDVDEVLPWIRPWFIRYQLPDGGLNCYDDAYRESHKSSIASSLPVFEAVMACAEVDGLSDEEAAFLDKAAEYLIKHRLVHRLDGALMDPDFMMLQFPRFYSYDVLRGLSFLTRWKNYRKSSEADEVINEGLRIIGEKLSSGMLRVERSDLTRTKTRTKDDSGEWHYGEPAKSFALLDEVNAIGRESIFLTGEYRRVMNTIIVTERLILRPFIEADFESYKEMLQDEAVYQWLGDRKQRTDEQVLKMMRYFNDKSEKDGHGVYAVALKESNKLIGHAGTSFFKDLDRTEYLYAFSKDYWGKGYATEIGRAYIPLYLALTYDKSLVAIAYQGNDKSSHVLEKLNFAKAGEKEIFGQTLDYFEYRRT
ncbi:MAG TPA: hypothetical protein DCS67_04630 [Clostridiales bacterium UBA8960]|nr:hypothetical protein [Clostridiales bacterium UBA8960]